MALQKAIEKAIRGAADRWKKKRGKAPAPTMREQDKSKKSDKDTDETRYQ